LDSARQKGGNRCQVSHLCDAWWKNGGHSVELAQLP
jgi:hypothetical protein